MALGILLFLFFFAIAINLPIVQDVLVKKVTAFIMEKAGHRSTLQGVSINWFDTIELHGITIYDSRDKPMIEAKRIDLDFRLLNLLADQRINFDKGVLEEARVTMTRNAPDDQFNFTYFIDKIKEELSREKKQKSARKFVITDLELINSVFSLDNTGRDSLAAHRFDHNHFILKGLSGHLSDFTLIPGEIIFQANKLTGYDSATDLRIEHLSVNYHFTRQSMVFQNMDLGIGESTIENSMIFEYDNPQALKDFVQNVKITTNIKKSLVNVRDVGYFAPSLQKYDQYFRLTGYYEGQVNRFNTKNLVLEFGRNSRIEGYFNMYGLPNFFETFINANITNANLNVYDLAPFLRQEDIENIAKFGRVNFSGRFSGFPNDFVSDGFFRTGIGNFDTDINVKIHHEDKNASTYSGRLKTENINLGLLLEDTLTYQNLAFSGKLSGTGFTRSSANLQLDASIKRLGYKGYEYQNIVTNARLKDNFFSGELKIDDPNLQFNGSMSIDYREELDLLQINAQLDTANLDELNLTTKEGFIRSKLDVNLRGLENQDLIGTAFFKDLFVVYDDREFKLDELHLDSKKDTLGRNILIESSMFDSRIIGDFMILPFLKDISSVAYEYWLNIVNDKKKLNDFYAQKGKNQNDYYYLDMEIKLNNINPLLNLFEPDLYVSNNSQILGSFTGGYTNILQLNSSIDTVKYRDIAFRDNIINIQTSNFADTSQIDAEIYIHSNRQYNSKKLAFQDLEVDVGWHNNHIEFLGKIDQYNTNNYVRLNGYLDLLADSSILKIEDSELKALEKTWQFSPENLITLQNKKFTFNDVELYNDNESISLNGNISENPEDNLFVSIKNLDVANVNPLITKELNGSLNGFIDIRDYYENKIINSRINIRDFKINKFEVGNIASAYHYENEERRFETTFALNYRQSKTLDINGYIYPFEKEQLDLTANFTNTNLYILEPFYDQIISDLKGNVDGNFSINGRVLKPVIKGNGYVDNGAVTLDYQKVRYNFTGEVEFDNRLMTFKNINLKDIRGNKGAMHGTIRHNFFKELLFDFDCDFTNFQVLNTTASDNDLFYGSAYATGNLKIFGEGKNVTFKTSAISNKDTKIFIPLNGSSEVTQEDFISFVKPKDTTSLEEEKEKFNVLDLTTLNFDFDLEITPDAYCEIIFDLTAGDIIRGRGNGKLKLYGNTDGDFEIYGNYDILSGGYNFTLYNIINKEFELHPDSRITWTGDPYHADLDIKASYRQLTSLYPIIGVEIENKPIEISRKYPTLVYLYIKGDMMSPDIDFDIEIMDYPENTIIPGTGLALGSFVQAFYNKLENDEQEMKKQVFSLIVLKNFSVDNAFNVSNTLENSVSELVSNQLSYWITQFDENLVVDIDVDLGTMSDEAFNTFQLRLSYSFLDGRLKVSRDGNFSSESVNNDPMAVIGDWTVEYLLTEDGKLSAKVYNKTNYNNYQVNNRTTQSTGISFMHTQSFDEFFKKMREKREDKRSEDQQKDKDRDKTKPADQAITKEEEITGNSYE